MSSLPRISLPRAIAGVLGLLLLFAAGPVQSAQAQDASQGQAAQEAPSPDAVADRMLASLTQQLDLSEDQQAEVRPILVSTFEEQRAMMKKAAQEDSNVDPKEMRQQMQQAQAKADKKLATVLDDEQMKKYRALKQQGPQQDGDPVDAAVQQLDAQLDLSDDQQAKVRGILESQAEQAKQLQQQLASADQQQRRSLMQKARKMQQQTSQRIEAVLTEEQVQKLHKLQQQRRQQMQKRQQQMEKQMEKSGDGNQ